MSDKKKQALLTGHKAEEWGKYRKSMVDAWNDWKIEVERMKAEQSKRSGIGKFLGTIAFGLVTTALTGGLGTAGALGSIAKFGKSIGTLGRAGLGTLFAGGTRALHHGTAGTADLHNQLDSMRDVYMPQFGKGQAAAEMAELTGQQDVASAQVDDYIDNFFPAWGESIGQGFDYMGSQVFDQPGKNESGYYNDPYYDDKG